MTLKTPFYDAFLARGGRFVDFSGWQMPVQFTGIIEEHMAVRQHVGLFDVSHMGEVRLSGPQAFLAAQALVARDLSKLKPNQACYTVMCQESGGIVDDLIVYLEHADSIFLVINAGTTAKDLAHIQQVCSTFKDVQVQDLSAQYALLALQGPQSDVLLSHVFHALPSRRFSFVDTTTIQDNIPVRIARTGYTGEKGVEIFIAPTQAMDVFLMLEQQALAVLGTPLKLCGLGARDSLRLEKKLALYGQDIDESTSPLEADLAWVVDLNKPHFVGQHALLKQAEQGLSRLWVGFKMQDKQIPRHGYAVEIQGQPVGVVTSGVMSPCLRVGIGCAYLPIDYAKIGQKIDIVVRQQRVLAEVVKTPFV